ncbi:MarR family winged helix-turn-helix transcriptional regulator [Gymnodinialimonas ulvae]|uniref:MarR family winged helix-turn-helix transcriptional regulator n=1 Tax=Gymnodinialimonas ulvae TaxID=3126504 RepID=UPI0030B4F428
MDHGAPTRAQRVAARKAQHQDNPFGRLQATASASRRQSQRLLAQAGGLSIAEWRILWDLCEAGPLSVQDMAQIQRTDHALISRALPGMREKGFVQVLSHTGDRRETLIEVLPAGTAAFAAAAPIMQRRRAALSEALTPEGLTQMIQSFDRLDAYLDIPIDALLSQEDAT